MYTRRSVLPYHCPKDRISRKAVETPGSAPTSKSLRSVQKTESAERRLRQARRPAFPSRGGRRVQKTESAERRLRLLRDGGQCRLGDRLASKRPNQPKGG